jgi:hypothetical protein
VKSEEFPQRARWDRRERLKFKDLAGVETVRGGSSFIYERQQRSDRLVDTVPLLRSLIFVIVRRIGRLGYPLKSGDRGKGAAVLRRNVTTNHPGQRAMVAFDTHDSSSGDT